MSNLGFTASNLMSADRRARTRAHIRQHLSFDYYAYDGQKIGVGCGLSVNISAGGILIETDKRLELMTPLLIEMISPLYMFMATGHVVHVQQTSDSQYQIGVSFHDIIQGGWELLVRASG